MLNDALGAHTDSIQGITEKGFVTEDFELRKKMFIYSKGKQEGTHGEKIGRFEIRSEEGEGNEKNGWGPFENGGYVGQALENLST